MNKKNIEQIFMAANTSKDSQSTSVLLNISEVNGGVLC